MTKKQKQERINRLLDEIYKRKDILEKEYRKLNGLGTDLFNLDAGGVGPKCIVWGCENHMSQGSFVGDICGSCYLRLKEGRFEHVVRDAGLNTKLSKAEASIRAIKSLLVEAVLESPPEEKPRIYEFINTWFK